MVNVVTTPDAKMSFDVEHDRLVRSQFETRWGPITVDFAKFVTVNKESGLVIPLQVRLTLPKSLFAFTLKAKQQPIATMTVTTLTINGDTFRSNALED
jgi:hypothetical protein